MDRYNLTEINPKALELKEGVWPERRAVLDHEIYKRLDSPASVKTFMQFHVFAVWDFMSVLKSLQQRLTGVTVPWKPVGDSQVRRLVNDIVLVEESDQLADGRVLSHFELYLEAMEEAGADTRPILEFIGVADRDGVEAALESVDIPDAARRFVRWTWSIVDQAPDHVIEAVFACGREDLIPEMFEQVEVLNAHDGRFSAFLDYLERHIEVDADEHTPMAFRMLSVGCGEDQSRWDECAAVVREGLTVRKQLWDGVVDALDGRSAPR